MRRCAYDEVRHDLHAFGLLPCKSMPSLATTLKERPFALSVSTVELPKLHSHSLHFRDATGCNLGTHDWERIDLRSGVMETSFKCEPVRRPWPCSTVELDLHLNWRIDAEESGANDLIRME